MSLHQSFLYLLKNCKFPSINIVSNQSEKFNYLKLVSEGQYLLLKYICTRVCVFIYLAGAYSTAVKAGFPVFSIASDSSFLWTVTAAARTRCTHTVVSSWEVHTHAVIPAGVCLQTALIDVWKSKERSWWMQIICCENGRKVHYGHDTVCTVYECSFVCTLLLMEHRKRAQINSWENQDQ